MEASHVRLLVVVVLVLLVSVVTADRRVEMVGSAAPEVEPAGERIPETDVEAARAGEVARIRTHLMLVEQELLSANVAHLSVAQRENRAQHIEVLREYRNRGIFPHNHEVLGRRVPVFIDEHGTHCAVGYLIAQSGRDDLARRIAAERNLARVPELVDIPGLVEWLNHAGLSVNEAARIQPAYDGWPGVPSREISAGYPAATALTAALGGGAVVWNVFAEREGGGWWVPGAAGIGVGTAGVALAAYGAGLNDANDVEKSHIVINAGIGLLSGILGVRTIALGRAAEPSLGDDGGQRTPPPAFQLSAWTPAVGGAGLRVGLRF